MKLTKWTFCLFFSSLGVGHARVSLVSGCQQYIARFRAYVEEKQNRLSYSEIYRLNRSMFLSNEQILLSMGLEPAKNYEEIDVYPDPDAFKRSLTWESFVDEKRQAHLKRFIVTLPEDVELSVKSPYLEEANVQMFERGSTIALLPGGFVELYQPADEPNVLSFREPY